MSIKPYYTSKHCTLYHGDCLEIMPLLDFGVNDMVAVTDPPYGIGASNVKRGGRQDGKSAAPSKFYEPADWDNKPPPQELFDLIKEKTKHQIIWGGNYFNLGSSPCWLVWDKDNGNNGYADCELAYTNLDCAVRKIRYRWMGMIQENMKNKEYRYHPTQKPVPVMEWCLSFINDTAIIIDPFSGSGTTGVACVNMNRQFVGIEMEEKYCEISARRIERAEIDAAQNLFLEPEPVAPSKQMEIAL